MQLAKFAPFRRKGAILMGELASVVIFAVSVIGFNQLVNQSIQHSVQMTNMNHAVRMAEDIFSRMSVRETARTANEYSHDHTTITCPDLTDPIATNIAVRDLHEVFCSPNLINMHATVHTSSAANIPDLNWKIQCLDEVAGTCPNGSVIELQISWPDTTSRLGGSNQRYNFVRAITLGDA